MASCSNTAVGAFTCLQSCFATTTGGAAQNSLDCTFSSNVTSGSMLYLTGGTFTGSETVTITGTGSCSTWNNVDNTNSIVQAYSVISSTGACTTTLTLSSGSHNIVYGVVEMAGTNQTLDGHNTRDAGSVTTGNPISPSAITTTVDGDLVLMAPYLYANASSPTYTAGGGGTILVSAALDLTVIQAQVQTTHGSITPSVTSDKTGSYQASGMVFQVAALPPPITTQGNIPSPGMLVRRYFVSGY